MRAHALDQTPYHLSPRSTRCSQPSTMRYLHRTPTPASLNHPADKLHLAAALDTRHLPLLGEPLPALPRRVARHARCVPSSLTRSYSTAPYSRRPIPAHPIHAFPIHALLIPAPPYPPLPQSNSPPTSARTCVLFLRSYLPTSRR